MTNHADRLNAFPVFMRVEDRVVAIVGVADDGLTPITRPAGVEFDNHMRRVG